MGKYCDEMLCVFEDLSNGVLDGSDVDGDTAGYYRSVVKAEFLVTNTIACIVCYNNSSAVQFKREKVPRSG